MAEKAIKARPRKATKAPKRATRAPKAMGRPSSFSERLVLRILELAKAGKTDAQIASEVGISTATLNNWKAAHPDFLTALKSAKDVADQLVEAALFGRAVGYSHTAVKFFWDAKAGKVVTQPYVERHAPDTTACIFWLKNRQPDRWRDRRETALTGENGGPVQMQSVTAEDVGREVQKRLMNGGKASEKFD